MPKKPRGERQVNEEVGRGPKKQDVEGLYIGRVGECPDTEEDAVRETNRRLRRAFDYD